MTPCLFSVYFKGTGPNAAGYERLARVLDYSARRHCPTWDVRVDALPPLRASEAQGLGHWLLANTVKLDAWAFAVQHAPEGHLLLLIDADMAVLAPLDPLLSMPFDLAYTTRPSRLPFNGGVLAVRANVRTRAFMAGYVARNRAMVDDPDYHKPFRQAFGGINQAAFGSLLGDLTPVYQLAVQKLPGAVWNCEQTTWATADPRRIRLLHVKSGLRRAVLYGQMPHAAPRTPRASRRPRARRPVRVRPSLAQAIPALAELWYGLERQATAAASRLTDTGDPHGQDPQA